MSRLAIYGLLGLAGAVGALGDTTLNHWATTGRTAWLCVSYAFWIASASLFGWVLKCKAFSFSGAVVMALLLHSLLCILVDRHYFGARLGRWEWLGVTFALAAIACIELGRQASSEVQTALPTRQLSVGRALVASTTVERDP